MPEANEEPRASGEGRRAFLGWRVVGGAFTAQALSTGLCFNPFGVFLLPVAENFGSSVGTVSAGLTIGMMVMAVVGPFVGRAADHGPVRAVMVAGVALLGIGLHLASRAEALWQAGLAFWLLMCLGAAMTGPIPTVTLVGNWFVRRRGIALGITVAGATVASMGAPGMAEWLIESGGWRQALRTMGNLAFLVGMPALWWLIVGRPGDVGQHADGDVPLDAGDLSPADRVVPVSVRDLRIWLVGLGFAFLFASPVVMTIHLPGYTASLGIERVGTFFLAMGPFSLLGKVIFGAVVDRVDVRHALYAAMAVLGLSWALVLFMPLEGRLWIPGAVFGLGVGAVGPLQGILTAACFGRGAVGRVMGLTGLIGLPLVAGSPALVGALYDLQGSYRTGLFLMAATLLVSAALFALLRIPDEEPGMALERRDPAAEGA